MTNNKKDPVILWVEDDLGFQRLIKRIISSSEIPDQNLIILDNGQDALNFLNNSKIDKDNQYPKPDIILLDLNIPKINGIELLKKIKSDPDLQLCIVIIISTSARYEDLVECYSAGANSYIVKPKEFNNIRKIFTKIYDYWCNVAMLPQKTEW